ncbi:sulfatase [Actinopolymorpha alba]|uniref:sulfatase family protein n=1 Tax=Actinopolymorpha alba TaxID=533267 RepID=UPI00146BDF1E|nr:sulfatase [Actinopolymorpha alba]
MPLTRRDIIAASGAAGVLAVTAGLTYGRRQIPTRSRLPNFVVIYVDDMGYADISCFGAPLTRTPVLDGMAARGMRLTSFYAGNPVCTPSRASMMTGMWAPRVNLPDVLGPDASDGLSYTQETLIPAYLKEAGYTSGIFGKWHLGTPNTYHPFQYGFDRWYGIPWSNDQWPVPIYDDEEIVRTIEGPSDNQDSLTREFTEKAVEFIDMHANEPFFLYLATSQPHGPIASEFHGRSAGGAYGDSVEEIDFHVGRLLAALDRNGLRDNTCVIFTSDNGPSWQDSGDSGPFLGRKFETYEGGMRAPCIVEWPEMMRRKGLAYEHPASVVDLLPTFCEAANVPINTQRTYDGTSILQALQSGRPVETKPVAYYRINSLNAMRFGRWKVHVRRVLNPPTPGRVGWSATAEMPQLFDLSVDEGECYDLSEHQPDLTQQLVRRLQDFDAALQADRARRYG